MRTLVSNSSKLFTHKSQHFTQKVFSSCFLFEISQAMMYLITTSWRNCVIEDAKTLSWQGIALQNVIVEGIILSTITCYCFSFFRFYITALKLYGDVWCSWHILAIKYNHHSSGPFTLVFAKTTNYKTTTCKLSCKTSLPVTVSGVN